MPRGKEDDPKECIVNPKKPKAENAKEVKESVKVVRIRDWKYFLRMKKSIDICITAIS